MHETRTIMSRDVVTVHPDTPITQVIDRLSEHDITGLPVVDAAGRLVGLITEKDIMGLPLGPEEVSGKAEDYMTRDVVSFDENDDVIAICECLVHHDFRRVPILSHGKLVGIISRRDLIKYIIEPIHA